MDYKEHKQYRLPGYDYSAPGVYYVTICVQDRLPVLATVGPRRGACSPDHNVFPPNDNIIEVILSPVGEIIKHFWLDIPHCFPVARLDEWVIMPDHMHGLIQLGAGLELDGNAPCEPAPRRVLHDPNWASISPSGQNVSGSGENAPRRVPTGRQPLKSCSLSSIINHFKGNVKRWCNQNGYAEFCWQPRFYDHIVRDDQDLIRIREYIRQNPEKWVKNNP